MSASCAGSPTRSAFTNLTNLIDGSPFNKRPVSPDVVGPPSKKKSPEKAPAKNGAAEQVSAADEVSAALGIPVCVRNTVISRDLVGGIDSSSFSLIEDFGDKTSGESDSPTEYTESVDYWNSPFGGSNFSDNSNSLSSVSDISGETFSSNFRVASVESLGSTLETASSFKSVRETLCKSPLISSNGNSVNDVYRVPANKNHRPYYFKNSGPVNEEKKLNLTLNKLFKQLLNDSSVQLGNYEELSDDELKFEPGNHGVQNIMLVQEEIDSRFKTLGSVENISQLYSFYNDGKDDQGRDLKGYFQRALLYTILTGQYDEHSGNLNQDKTTKELCRYDLDLSFSGGRILKDYVDFIKYGDVLTRFGLRSVLLFAITEDSNKLLVDECLSEDLKSDLLTLISTNLDDHFPTTISEETSKLKQFINSNFLKIKGLLDSEESVTLLDVLKVCYPEVAITLEESRNLLNAELLEKPQDNKAVLKTWFNAVNKCFGDSDFFEDMIRTDLGDGNLNFLGKITAHLFNEDGSVKTFLPESIADINKS